MVKATRAYEHLGPRSGISDVRRLFRGINLGIISWELLRSGEASSRDLQWESIQSSKATSAPQRSSVGTLVDEGRAAVTGTVNSRRATMEYGRRVYPNEKIVNTHVMVHGTRPGYVIVIIYSPDIYKIMGRVRNGRL